MPRRIKLTSGRSTFPTREITWRRLLLTRIWFETEVCLVHGDLNFKNILFDDTNNIWFIDWTHNGTHPIEVDFAKLERMTLNSY